MSSIDSELERLRLRLAALEEQKRIEEVAAAEKSILPMKTLEGILDKKRKQIEVLTAPNRNQTFPIRTETEQIKENLAYLEPIFNMLKNIQERLEVLEKK